MTNEEILELVRVSFAEANKDYIDKQIRICEEIIKKAMESKWQ